MGREKRRTIGGARKVKQERRRRERAKKGRGTSRVEEARMIQ